MKSEIMLKKINATMLCVNTTSEMINNEKLPHYAFHPKNKQWENYSLK